MPEHQLSKEQEQPIVQKRTSNNDGKTVNEPNEQPYPLLEGKAFGIKVTLSYKARAE